MKTKISLIIMVAALATFILSSNSKKEEVNTIVKENTSLKYPTTYNTIEVNGLEIFYREAGRKDAPTLVLLHGYPTSSYMFRNLIKELSSEYHLIAPDYPGFGRSEQPAMKDFEYTFDGMADIVDGFLEKLNIQKYSLYVMDYGAPVGYRVFAEHPERVTSFIVQNGNAYEEGLTDFWNPLKSYWKKRTPELSSALEKFHQVDGLKWQYLHGVQDSSKVSPDNWLLDLQHLKRPENNEIQLQLFYDYGTNVKHYASWQKLFKQHQPPMLIVWGKNDVIFPPSGAHPYKEDLNNIEFHLLDTGHFALEEKGDEIAGYIQGFLKKNKIK
ncbi:alpha/beta hydrolase [Dokdonia sp.]|uniref:alpha/beta fold hydrolase n=1 Tax=Dokdonia sp. TaxID=2024995 RepID=UPI003263D20C